MKSWNGSVNEVVAATARSTYASPSTARLTAIPCRVRSASSMVCPFRQRGLDGLVGRQSGGDEAAGGAQVASRLERRLDLLGRDARGSQAALELGNGQQHVAQRQARADRSLARLGHQVVRLDAAEHAGQQ